MRDDDDDNDDEQADLVTDKNVFLQYIGIGIYAVILLFECRSWNVSNRKVTKYL